MLERKGTTRRPAMTGRKRKTAIRLALLTGVMLLAGSAHAAGTIGTMADTLSNALDEIPSALAGGSYVAGAVLLIKGLLSLRDHSEDHKSHPLTKSMSQIVAAAMLIAIPSTMSMGITSLFGSKAQNRIIDHGG